MEKVFEQYSLWMSEVLPKDLKDELILIKDNNEELYDRFCSHIMFGTSGLRGKMGAGTARMNSVVIRRATDAIADYLLSKCEKPVMAISYDTRKNSRTFAEETAKTLSNRGVGVVMMKEPQPVPLLSFVVRKLGLNGGVMITASHNPKEYNGYKVYDSKGNQIDDKKARLIEEYICKRDYFEEICPPREKGEIKFTPDEIIADYRESIGKHVLLWDEEECAKDALAKLEVTYTPLNGTGLSHATAVFKNLGIEKVNVVSSQMEGDGEFRTCPSPNPENVEAFAEAIKEHGDKRADIILATDPDSDRVGVMVLHNGVYVKLSGNQVGELICDYICSSRKDSAGKWIFKSIVTSPFADVFCKANGINICNTLTGFKNIAVKMEELEAEGRGDDFLFGFEESIGYLYGTYTRDKDAIMGCQLICLTAAKCKAEGITMVDRLQQLYDQYGYMEARSGSRYFQKEKDRLIMDSIMEGLFDGNLKELLGREVECDLTFKEQNVFQGKIGKDKFIVRPSGTELKIKMYVFAGGANRKEATERAEKLLDELKKYIEDQIRNKE